jgi:hypothetical protein
MPSYQEIAARWLHAIPEIRILQDIGRALGTPLRIHGGFARNLLSRAIAGQDSVASDEPLFTNLVDPFSDIDIVVPTRADFAPVLSAIYSRISVAPALRWELKTAAQVDYHRKHDAVTSVDEVEVFVGPDTLGVANEQEAAQSFRNHRLKAHVPQEWRWRQNEPLHFEATILALRMARFWAQFDLVPEETPFAHQAAERERAFPAPRRNPLITIAAIDVLFNASNLETAQMALEWAQGVLPSFRERHGPLMRRCNRALKSDRFFAVVYPSSEGSRLHAELYPSAPRRTDHTAAYASLIPWTPIVLPAVSSCCPPLDFAHGSLTIAWRGVAPMRDAGAVVLAPAADPYADSSHFLFGVPSVVDSYRSTVLRIDWGFAAEIAGRGRPVFVGARDFSASDEFTQ